MSFRLHLRLAADQWASRRRPVHLTDNALRQSLMRLCGRSAKHGQAYWSPLHPSQTNFVVPIFQSRIPGAGKIENTSLAPSRVTVRTYVVPVQTSFQEISM